MEGILADECYHQAKSDGCNVVVVWQDGNSSSQKSVEKVFGAELRRVFKCGVHVGRAHANNLKDLAKQKVFSAGQISKWTDTFPAVESAKCACKRHSKTCGCLSDAFIQGAQLNHFCCLQQCKSPDDYARSMRSLGVVTAKMNMNGMMGNVISTPVLFVLVVHATKMRKYPVRERRTPPSQCSNASFIS